jgi:tetratricopeptide (TPR) repeat protein
VSQHHNLLPQVSPHRAGAFAHTRLLHATLFICVCFNICLAQGSSVERAREWKSYALPTSEFTRLVDEENGVVVRVPANWKTETVARRQGQEKSYSFTGPNAAVLQISVEKIPSGLPLQSYSAAILQQLRDLPGSGDSLSVRQTEMSGLDAREIAFELPDESGILTRRIIWCAVDGPVAVAAVLIEPEDHIAEIEPYLRAVVDSLTICDNDRLTEFEATRTAAIKEPRAVRIDEVQSLVLKINGLDVSGRTTAVDRLSQILATTPDAGIDLLLDRRPIVRAAVVEAIARSKNRGLDPFLIKGLHDRESFVAERAARAVAALPNAVALMRDETLSWMSTELLARVWPFFDRKAQLQIFSEAFLPQTEIAVRAPRRTPAARPGKMVYGDPSVQLGLLPLLREVPAQDFKLPWSAIAKAQSEALTAAALQVALERGESLPFNDLFKLLSLSPSFDVRRMAAKNLGESGTAANLPQLEQFLKVMSAGGGAVSDQQKTKNDVGALVTELQLTINKIRLQNDLSIALPEQKSKLIADARNDPEMAEWVWKKYVSGATQSAASRSAPVTLSVSPFGENAFPKAMTHYVAIPSPASAVSKLGASLNNIQMDSARAQANLVLMLTAMSRLLGEQLGAAPEDPLLDYAGLKANAPMSFGQWTAADAPSGIAAAERKAMIVHVGDRDRFERTLAFYQSEVGGFSSFPAGAAIAARFLPLLPAIFPLSANMIFQDTPRREHDETILRYDFIGPETLDGYAIKRFTAQRVSTKGNITSDSAYVVYLGDAALLTADLASMRDVLTRLRDGGATLDQDEMFKSSRQSGGEAFYFSNLTELFSQPGARDNPHVSESGVLQVSNNTWESSYHVTFDYASWSRSLLAFKPDELTAPRDLLPRSTVLYSFIKLNGPEMLSMWRKVATPAELKGLTGAWSVDFEKEVLPEFDSECGAALLDLPNLAGEHWQVHWILFLKLKSDRLQHALEEGRLLKDATLSKGVATIKFDSSPFYVAVKHGFLVASDNQDSLALIDQKDKLLTAPDFVKAITRSPGAVVAFGGYNLEAAGQIAGANPDTVKAQQADVLLSLVRAFHSPTLYATINGNSVDARSSISMDREGRYSVAELQALTANSEPTFAVLRPQGLAITGQNRLDSLRLRIRARAAGEIERIAEDLSAKSQTIEKRSEQELQVQILTRRTEPKQRMQLPITTAEVAGFLSPSKDIPADDKTVAGKAREIAGSDRDAWSVARKLADWTFKNLTWKRVDYADAAQTLATREADCYEFSKLYVAMARSVGLPARVVSGMAYGDGSFGGHAWVEVYIGDWIEIDPTWGTSFVDATHIKVSTGALLTYAALNLVQLEVLNTPHSVAEYQREPGALVGKICEELSAGKVDALQSAVDVAAITDDLMGAGSWDAMTDKERDQMSGSHARVLNLLAMRLTGRNSMRGELRLLKIKTDGNEASALAMSAIGLREDLLKLSLAKRGNVWLITEVTEVDTGLKLISENLQPAVTEIRDRRNGKPRGSVGQTEFARVIVAMEKDNHAALALLEGLLKNNPRSQSLRYLRSLCLSNTGKYDDAAGIWEELVGEQPAVAPAFRELAAHYAASKEAAQRAKGIELYKRYLSLEPDDPRGHTGLADLYQDTGAVKDAEAEYRAAVDDDATNSVVYIDLANFYARQKRFAEAGSTLDEAVKRATDKDDLLAELIGRSIIYDNPDVAEGLAASQPERMAHSAAANLSLARIRIDHNHPREALPLLRKAAALDAKSSDAHDLMAEAFRKLHEWTAALNSADTAVALSKDDADAYYNRACALARLGRRTEAISALKRALELDDERADTLSEEEDLKSLALLPEFKKLLPKDPPH